MNGHSQHSSLDLTTKDRSTNLTDWHELKAKLSCQDEIWKTHNQFEWKFEKQKQKPFQEKIENK